MKREAHLKAVPYRNVDLNRESHLKHPAWSGAQVRNYRQLVAVSADHQSFWARLIKKLFG